MPAIDTSEATIYTHPIAVVSTSPILGGTWTDVAYLRVAQLRKAAAPDVSQATLLYSYGRIQREDLSAVAYYPPIDLAGKFVRIVITDTVLAGDPPAPANSIKWFGVIQPDIRHPDGSTPSPGNQASGTQEIIAYGLERLLEQTVVSTSKVDIDGTEGSLYTVRRGLPFNADPGGQFPRRGNRSSARVPAAEPAGSFVFSWEPREKSEWDAWTAVEYLLKHHSPATNLGGAANTWSLVGTESILDWYDIALPTEGHTLKQLLDALIPRSRGVSYWVDFDEDTETVQVKPFTFVSAAVVLPDGSTIPANPNAYTLDFEHSLDVSSVVITNTAANLYHRVIARGARRTTTFTTRLSELSGGAWTSDIAMGPGWDPDLETEYKQGASGSAGYGALDETQKQFRNSIARRSDRLEAVYQQFVLNSQLGATRWSGRFPQQHQPPSATRYWLVPDISETAVDPTVADPATAGVDWIPGLRFLPHLPLYEQYDYSAGNLASFSYAAAFTAGRQPGFLRPLVYGRTYGDDFVGSPRYEAIDRGHRPNLIPKDERPRDWSVEVGVLNTCPGIELRTRVAHFLAAADAGAGDGWATTADEELGDQHGAIPYKDLWCTLCVELNVHLQVEEVLSEPEFGAPENVLLLDYPDARADYVVPYTTVEIKDGSPVQTTSGGFAKDDRLMLEARCRGAAEWYGKVRQTLKMQFQQIRSLVELGWLITSVGSNYSLASINTPITGITYDLGDGNSPGSTTIETGFANLDFRA